MASSKEYLDFILEQLSELDDVSYRAMMGEYIIYYRGKVVGGIYDDRFLVKPTKSAVAMMPNAEMELPYEGAKEMLLVDDVDNKGFLRELLDAMYDELAAENQNVVHINISGQFDTEHNMPTATRSVNARNSAEETYQSNGVHPANSGYMQIADAAVRCFVGLIEED